MSKPEYYPEHLALLQALAGNGPATAAQLGVTGRTVWGLRDKGVLTAEPGLTGRWVITDKGRELLPKPTMWPEGLEGGSYHDTRCQCPGHCRNCFANLDEVRQVRDRMIAKGAVGPNGPYTEADRLPEQAMYCSPYCQRRYYREVALDRALAAQDSSPGRGGGLLLKPEG